MRWTLFIVFLATTFPALSKAGENIQVFVGQLLNSKHLDDYWHIEIFPERVPVIVSLPFKVKIGETQIKKFGKPVVFTHKLQKYKNVFAIQSFNVKDGKSTIEFVYNPEGIRGLATYEKKDKSWRLVNVEITER
ncbi:hypothetical protein JYT31_01145 [Beggiatoa alba]|nr:hypothetical protein [Beggiatoa alba]